MARSIAHRKKVEKRVYCYPMHYFLWTRLLQIATRFLSQKVNNKLKLKNASNFISINHFMGTLEFLLEDKLQLVGTSQSIKHVIVQSEDTPIKV